MLFVLPNTLISDGMKLERDSFSPVLVGSGRVEERRHLLVRRDAG